MFYEISARSSPRDQVTNEKLLYSGIIRDPSWWYYEVFYDHIFSMYVVVVGVVARHAVQYYKFPLCWNSRSGKTSGGELWSESASLWHFKNRILSSPNKLEITNYQRRFEGIIRRFSLFSPALPSRGDLCAATKFARLARGGMAGQESNLRLHI